MSEWIDINDSLPTRNGIYNTKCIVGSIAPKKQERTTLFKNYATGGRFVAGDWVTITHWTNDNVRYLPESPPKDSNK